ncbi:hypothetical protein Ddye_004732 [Dipteronia dyeriana]|uniref:Uncharacterized protein n=1 Tax=Dipteronia dyeriana TaxID=168575 RepID=A0AAD9XEX5_9ROSI|nr:hypothetical protein Ddye_004732 [Dipteronia dyeriana]
MAGGFFRIKSVLGRPGKTDWIERRCLCLFFMIGFPSFEVSGEGDKGEAPNMFYPQPPSVISNLNPLFLFTSTQRASSPFTIDVTDQPHSSGQQPCPASSADCQPVQLTPEDSSHPAQHVSFNQDKPIICLVRVDHSSDFSRSLVITLHSSSLALFFTGLPGGSRILAYLALAADFPARVSELVEHSPIGTQSGPCLGAGLKSRAVSKRGYKALSHSGGISVPVPVPEGRRKYGWVFGGTAAGRAASSSGPSGPVNHSAIEAVGPMVGLSVTTATAFATRKFHVQHYKAVPPEKKKLTPVGQRAIQVRQA